MFVIIARERIPKRIKKIERWNNFTSIVYVQFPYMKIVLMLSNWYRSTYFIIYSVLRLSGELPSARERESNMFEAFPMTTSTTLNSLACEHNFRLFESKKHLDTPRGAYFFFHNHRHLFSLLHNVRNVKLNKQAAVDEAASVFFSIIICCYPPLNTSEMCDALDGVQKCWWRRSILLHWPSTRLARLSIRRWWQSIEEVRSSAEKQTLHDDIARWCEKFPWNWSRVTPS